MLSSEFFTIISDSEELSPSIGYKQDVVARLTNGNVEGALILNTPDLSYRAKRNECVKCGRTDVTQNHSQLCRGIVKCSPGHGSGRSYDGEGSIVQPVPNADGREVGYIVGQSGAGKTVFLVDYVIEYLTMFDRNHVYIFTGATVDDPAYKRIRDNERLISRVTFCAVDKSILEKELVPESFENSLVVFDDTSAIEDKKTKAHIDGFRSRLCLVGRHKRVSVINTNHLECEFQDKSLKTAVTESHFVVVFPKFGSENGLNRLLTTWYGLPHRTKEDKEVLAKIKSVPSRWVYLRKGYPKYAIHQGGAFIL